MQPCVAGELDNAGAVPRFMTIVAGPGAGLVRNRVPAQVSKSPLMGRGTFFTGLRNAFGRFTEHI